MSRDRRQQARTAPSELGFIQIGRDEGGRIVNICEAGLCFETFAPVERQRRLEFWFSLNLRERVEASGRLAWLDAEGKVGGLRFLDLSARARRHLRAYLGTSPESAVEEPSGKLTALLAALEKQSPGTYSFEPHNALRAVAFQEPDSVASRWSEASTAVPKPRFDSVDRNSKEESRPKGAVFFAALAAERALRQRTNKSETDNTPVLQEANPGPRDSADAAGLERAAVQPTSNFASSQDAADMVSLEWHLMDNRRHLKRGILFGVLVSLIFAIAGGRYFGRKPSGSERGVSPVVVPLPAVAPGTPAGSGASETRYSPDDSGQGAVFAPSSSPGAIPRANETGTSKSLGADVNAATPEQLWLAVEKGNTAAAVELADRFLQGNGVPVNCAQARVLLLVASEKNNADAIRKLDQLNKTGCPKP